LKRSSLATNLLQQWQNLGKDERNRMLRSAGSGNVFVVSFLLDLQRLEQGRYQLEVENGLGFALLAALDAVQRLKLGKVRGQDGFKPEMKNHF